MTERRRVLMLGGCVLVTWVALAGSVAYGEAGKPARRSLVVPAKTALDVRLATTIEWDTHRAEDPVLASLASPLIVDGVSVAPTASVLSGNITLVAATAAEGRRAVAVRFDRLRVGATTYDIRTAPIRYVSETANDSNGERIRVHSGTRLRVELMEPLRMEVRLK